MSRQPPPSNPSEKPATAEPRQKSSSLSLIWRLFRSVLIGYLIVCLAAMFFEEFLMFPASRYPEGYWDITGLDFEDAQFAAEDGTQLHGWYAPADEPRAHLLFCHGNAGNITDRSELVRFLRDDLQVSVLAFDYRGYGKSEGRPNEKGVIADGRAARAWLAERAGIDPTDVVLMGRSMGGAVAVALAAEQPARGLILESTFSSMTDVASHHYRFLPVRLFLRNRFDSLSRISGYDGPLLASHSRWDEVVPFKFGEKLFEAAPSGKKQFIIFDELRHNDPTPAKYYVALNRFLDELPQPKGQP